MPKEPTSPTADLINALAEFENVKANKINPAFSNAGKKSGYVSLDALLEAIKPILHKHNLALIQTLISEEGKVGIETSFLHSSGTSFTFGKLMIKSENMTPQNIASAVTYLRRITLTTSAGISVDSDFDGNGLSAPVAQQPQVNATKAIQAAIAQPVSAPLKQSYIPGTNNAR